MKKHIKLYFKIKLLTKINNILETYKTDRDVDRETYTTCKNRLSAILKNELGDIKNDGKNNNSDM